MEHPKLGKYHTMGIPMKFSKTPGDPTMRRPAYVGEHGREILADIGYTADEIDTLCQNNVIYISGE